MVDQYDYILTALCLWREGRGETVDGRRAIYHVIQNRVKSNIWPNTAAGVILQRLQFSCFNPNDPNAKLLPTATDKQWLECRAIVDDPGSDPTAGANHYHVVGLKPVWADPAKVTLTFGNHVFYRL
jgi:N-acetylmuramoyl-L-alanine amidase